MAADPNALRAGFAERVRPPRAVVWVWASMGRFRFALVLALIPSALLLAYAFFGPASFLDQWTSPLSVRPTFGRFISGIATASSIAVSVALLAMGREMRGVSDTQDALRTNEAFRDRVRERLDLDELPVLLPDLIRASLDGLADAADDARRALPPAAQHLVSGAPLAEALGALSENARKTARHVDKSRKHPDKVHLAFLDHEMVLHSATIRRALRKEGLSSTTKDKLETLHRTHDDLVILQRYVKTLDFQWGLSRMSQSVLLSAFPAVALASVIAMGYGEWVRETWGLWGAAAILSTALVIALLPLALFLTHILRFITLTRYTLSTDLTALGPELSHLESRERPRTRGRASP